MSHVHNIVDTGNRFVINPELRTITTKTSEIILSQGDHNSKRYTFEVPRIVEGHDMTLCNRIEIHYDNISKNKKELSEGFYVSDDHIVEGDVVVFTWLISGNVTRLAGSVQFWISFSCIDENGEIVYSWGTDVFKGVRVIANNRNTEEVIATFPDVLEQWKEEVLSEVGTVGESHITFLESPDPDGNILCIRDLDSGVYILKGKFEMYKGHTSPLTFSGDSLATITKNDTNSNMQIMSAEHNTIDYYEITDDSVFSKNVDLTNVPTETRVSEMINEALGVVENGSY